MFDLKREVDSYEKKVNNLRIKFIDRITKQYRLNQVRRAAIEATRIELEVEDAELESANYQIEQASAKINSKEENK
jgi:hypothetical protein